jgi:hypothetical protein
MEKPTIVLIPGLWEGPSVFTSISTTLQALGYPTLVAKLPSTGTTSSDPDRHTITMRDDEQAIRYMVKPLVIDKGKTVIMVIIPSYPSCPAPPSPTSRYRTIFGEGEMTSTFLNIDNNSHAASRISFFLIRCR